MPTPARTTRDAARSGAPLNAQVRNDGEVLSALVRLLTNHDPLPQWPSALVAALAQAIAPDGSDAREAEKARRLRRHLFIDLAPPAFPISTGAPGRWSDRVRADLADLVPFGTGLHLVDTLMG